MIKKIKIDRTFKKGYPAAWEVGGGYTNTGEASIICDRNGQPKEAIYIRRRGHLANDRHALILVNRGDYIVKAWQHRGDFLVKIYQVIDFEREAEKYSDGVEAVNMYSFIREKYRFDRGEWSPDLPEFLEAAVEAAKDKALCYHCRCVHYAITE